MTRRSLSARWAVLALAVALMLVPFGTPAASDPLASVRANFFAYYSGSGARPADPRWQDSLATLERDARSFMRAGYLRSDGSWSDIDYSEVPAGNWSPWDHFRRLIVLAKAYRTPGQALYGDPQLRLSIESAIAYVPTFYGPSVPQEGNWWFWVIGAPLDLAPTLVLMQDAIRPDVTAAATDAMARRIGPSPYYYPPANLLKGQNLVWSALNHLSLALLQGNETMMRDSRDAIASVARVTPGLDGIQNDFTFHQHGPQLYTGGYGGSFANDVGKFVMLTRNTGYALPSANLAVTSDYMVEGISWGLYQNYFDVSLVGREVSKPSTSGYNGLAALLQMSEVPTTRQAEIRAATARMLQSWSWSLPTELAAIASRFDGTAVTPAWPSGNRHMFESDYSVHRRPGWFSSVKMFSNRTESGERTNGENILGSRQSDGRFYLTLKGDEYFGNAVWPTLDWSRLPGITVERTAGAANSTYGLGTRSFVGGVSDGRNGMAAMELAPLGSTLRAKKAWLFLDDAVVFLNTEVNLVNGNSAETIVNQWPLSRADAPLVVDGRSMPSQPGWSATLQNISWAAVDNVGYYFPEGATVQAKRELRSGSWSLLGSAAPDPTIITRPVFTLWFDHGAWVTNGQAVYAVVPNASATAMASWAASRPISVLRNDSYASAVRDSRTNTTGAVFWQPSAAGSISVDRPAILYLTETTRTANLQVSDPTHATAVVRVTLPGVYRLTSGPVGTSVAASGRNTVISVPVKGGRTSSVILSRPARLRPVRR